MRTICSIGLTLFYFSTPAFADLPGCTNSPENPTLILGLLGGAAASLPWIRSKLAARKKPRDL